MAPVCVADITASQDVAGDIDVLEIEILKDHLGHDVAV